MNSTAIYSKTGKGARALASKSKALSSDALRVLSYIDGKTSAEAILLQLGKFPENKFNPSIDQLLSEGYIKEIDSDYLSQSLSNFDIHTPIIVAEISAEEFMQIEAAAGNANAEDNAKQQAEAEARAQLYAEAQRKLQDDLLKQEEAERRLLTAADILAKSGESLDIERLAINAPHNNDAVGRPKQKVRKRTPAEQARHEAKKRHREEAEKAAAQAQLQTEAAERIRQDQEEKQRREAIVQAERAAAERALQEKREAEKLAEEARLDAMRKAAEDMARQREAEKRARAEAEHLAAQVKKEAKLKAQEEARQLAEVIALQQAEARAQRKAEKQARIEAEKRAKAERKAAEEAKVRTERKAKEKSRAEYRARLEVEAQALKQAKLLAARETENQARLVAEKKAQEKAQQLKLRQAEKAAKAAAKQQAQQLAATEALGKAEEKRRRKEASPAVNYIFWADKVWGHAKNTFIACSLIVLLLLAVLPFINLSFLIAPAQQLATQTLGETVNIQALHIGLWPQPRLVLDKVSIGSAPATKLSSISLVPVISTLNDKVKVFRSIEIERLALDENNAGQPIAWLNSLPEKQNLQIARIKLNQTEMIWPGVTLPAFNADIYLASTGVLQKAVLQSENDDLLVTVIPNGKAYAVNLAATAWRFPIGLPVVFDKLYATGKVSNNLLQFDSIKGRLYDGNLSGLMTLDWSNGWHVNGKFNLAQIDLTQALPVFTQDIGMDGRLSADAVLALKAQELDKILNEPSIEGHFRIAQGAIKGIDLVRAIRANGKEKAINGTTRFDEFSGNLTLENKHYQFRELSLQANQLQARGEADVFANQDLSGKIEIKLGLKSRQLQSRIYLSGKLSQPALK